MFRAPGLVLEEGTTDLGVDGKEAMGVPGPKEELVRQPLESVSRLGLGIFSRS